MLGFPRVVPSARPSFVVQPPVPPGMSAQVNRKIFNPPLTYYVEFPSDSYDPIFESESGDFAPRGEVPPRGNFV